MYHILFIHSSVDGHLDCFYLAIVNNAAVNIHMQVFVWTHAFIFLGYLSRNGITGSHAISMFNFWETARLFYKVYHFTSRLS